MIEAASLTEPERAYLLWKAENPYRAAPWALLSPIRFGVLPQLQALTWLFSALAPHPFLLEPK